MFKHAYFDESITLLKEMIAIPSVSREEEEVANRLFSFLANRGLEPFRKGHNVWAIHPGNRPGKPVILLNSHIDTVKPANGWISDPYTAVEENGRITGLGSNDAGASVVALLAAFRLLCESEQPYNLIFAATSEEEISGSRGVASILDALGSIELGIVGEPTGMQMAVAEKGLMVIDGLVKGKSGHAAREEGENAIYKALPVIEKFKRMTFPLSSDFLGPVKITVTGIESGTQHNVVPDACRLMVDVRVNENYTNEQLFKLVQEQVDCELIARSFRLNSSSIPVDHPLVKRGEALGLSKFGSPTTSDQAVMPFPTLKIGPGDSARSHTPNEYIYLSEIAQGVDIYYKLLHKLNINTV